MITNFKEQIIFFVGSKTCKRGLFTYENDELFELKNHKFLPKMVKEKLGGNWEEVIKSKTNCKDFDSGDEIWIIYYDFLIHEINSVKYPAELMIENDNLKAESDMLHYSNIEKESIIESSSMEEDIKRRIKKNQVFTSSVSHFNFSKSDDKKK